MPLDKGQEIFDMWSVNMKRIKFLVLALVVVAGVLGAPTVASANGHTGVGPNGEFLCPIVGDGVLRQSLEDYVKELGAGSVHFVGFRNRDQIVNYYAISDLLILQSVRETWGIVVNEAMCFGLPVIVSHQVGAGIDLVTDGQNGYSVAGDVDSLSRRLKQFAELSGEERLQMGMRSVEAINDWIDRDLAEVLIQCVQSVKGQRPV